LLEPGFGIRHDFPLSTMVMVPKERKRPGPLVPARRPHCPSKDVDGMKVVLQFSILVSRYPPDTAFRLGAKLRKLGASSAYIARSPLCDHV
jgi:hypothetical protein